MRISHLWRVLPILAALVSVNPATAAEPTSFPLKDGDTWVMAGDSITAQKLHSNYFEAFCYARFPKMTFRFRNSGVGGDTIGKVMARFDWDVAVWKPTIVSVELGMNDQGGTPTDKYILNMGDLDGKIRGVKALPIYFTASPINNGSTMKNISGNAKLNDYALALQKFAVEKKSPFADQFHQLVDVWGYNKPRETLLTSLATMRNLAKDDKLEGVEHLRMFLEVQQKNKTPLVSMMGDPVHPGATGQLTMAAALLKDLGANPMVSSVTFDTTGKVMDSKGCEIKDVKLENGKLTFTRTDETLPFPIPDEARPVLSLYPTILELSQYTLTIQGLKGDQQILVNGVALGTVTAAELEKGINLTAFDKGVIADQGKQILAAVSAKEGLVSGVRSQSKAGLDAGATADVKEKFAAALKKVEEADAKIREAAKAKALKFEIVPVK